MLIKRENKHYLLFEIEYSSFVKTQVPFAQGCFVLCLVEIGPLVLEEKMM